MSAYPTFNQALGSGKDSVDGRQFDRAESGGMSARNFFTVPKAHFSIKHFLSDTDLATFEAFYAANRNLAITFVWAKDLSTYTCIFGADPKYEYPQSGLTIVTVDLYER